MRAVAALAVASLLAACTKAVPLEGVGRTGSPSPSATVRIHGFVSFPCDGPTARSPSDRAIIFRTRAGSVLGRATTGETRYFTRDDGRCGQRAAYEIVLPRLAAYVAHDPLHPRDLRATFEQLERAGFEWDFRA